MLKANELRIGNWINLSVNPNINFYGKVLSIGSLEQEFEQIYCECEESFEWAFKDNYSGIPLTSEIMERCGFRDTMSYYSKGQFFLTKMYLLNGVEICYNAGTAGIRTIKYLHQLQNLYFSLTGSELEIKMYA